MKMFNDPKFSILLALIIVIINKMLCMYSINEANGNWFHLKMILSFKLSKFLKIIDNSLSYIKREPSIVTRGWKSYRK